MNYKLLAISSLIVLLPSFHAEADLGFARLDSESYYLNSNARPDNTVALVFGPDLQTTGGKLTAKFELEGYLYVNDPASFTVESQNAYVASSPELSSRHQLTLGRRMYDWSVSDDIWKMGTWTPRFNWDPLNPEQVGNTGAFYTYESKSWRLLTFVSGIAIPERGVPLNSNLTSPSGDWVSPFSQINLPALNNAQVPIQYNIAYPPIGNLVFFPSAALQIKHGEKYGSWVSAEYGYMPIHQPDLLVEGLLPAQSRQLDVTIHPVILMQHLITLETGYKEKNWSFWGSVEREIPILQNQPETWIQQPMGPATLLSAGSSWEAVNGFTISASALSVSEILPAQALSDNLSLNLPSRFPYSAAVQVGLDWKANERWSYRTLWIDDIANISDIVSLDLSYRPSYKSAWFVGLGTDFITSSTGQGLIGQFEGNDRMRMRLAYAL